ncbi:hypothetical protein [Paraclostridium sordellii]|uniref:hypothetical protein n=1 Tax=Paraclostridium sordellii TaxID=1505 RepID=UPI0005DD40F7|nr:hypothetical protein [Paeniclostridium sordellii]CEP41624.1 Uncharacterised protein [[Clostridium] sordellii] [Paeniclostridium sordellii]
MDYDNFYIQNVGLIWEIIKLYEGEVFKTKVGVPFTYKAYTDYIIINETNQTIKKEYFKLACRFMPDLEIKNIQKITRGPQYIYAILTSNKIKSNIENLEGSN